MTAPKEGPFVPVGDEGADLVFLWFQISPPEASDGDVLMQDRQDQRCAFIAPAEAVLRFEYLNSSPARSIFGKISLSLQ